VLRDDNQIWTQSSGSTSSESDIRLRSRTHLVQTLAHAVAVSAKPFLFLVQLMTPSPSTLSLYNVYQRARSAAGMAEVGAKVVIEGRSGAELGLAQPGSNSHPCRAHGGQIIDLDLRAFVNVDDVRLARLVGDARLSVVLYEAVKHKVACGRRAKARSRNDSLRKNYTDPHLFVHE
jgi:hypothetical protein